MTQASCRHSAPHSCLQGPALNDRCVRRIVLLYKYGLKPCLSLNSSQSLRRTGPSIRKELTTCDTTITEMDRTAARDKGIAEAEDIEIVQDRVAQLQPTHYRPQSDAEKRLDKRVNRKLDLIVVTLLAVEFIVCAVMSLHHFTLLTRPSSVASTKQMSASSPPARLSKMPT